MLPRLFLIAVTVLIAGPSFAEEEGPLYITADALIDVERGVRVESPVIVVEGQRIAMVGSLAAMTWPADARQLHLSGHTLLPGLMDMHVHLSGNATIPFFEGLSHSIPRQTVTAVGNARRSLMAGFTTVRDVGAAGYSVIGVRDGINAGDIEGPRIFASGPALGVTGGHCDNNFPPPEQKIIAEGVADGPWAARAKVRENIKYGADLIKFCATGGVFSKGTKVGIQQYTQEEMTAIVEEAHLRGLTVAAHAHGTDGIKAAIRAGVDSVEHASFLDAEAIALAKEYGTALSMDIYNTEYTLTYGEENGVPEENLDKERQVSKAQRDSFTAAVRAGVTIVFGTDAAIYPHGDNARQFARMVRFGMTPIQAIRSATIQSARLLRKENELGVLKQGYLADIIAVSGDPLADVSVLENVTFVMKDGAVYKAP